MREIDPTAMAAISAYVQISAGEGSVARVALKTASGGDSRPGFESLALRSDQRKWPLTCADAFTAVGSMCAAVCSHKRNKVTSRGIYAE